MLPHRARRRPDRRSRWAVLCTALLALLFVAGSWAAPLLQRQGYAAGGAIHLLYAPLCHQMPQRSLAVGDGHQAVCARCAGLYIGGVAGLFVGAWLGLSPSRRPRPFWLALALAPTMIDAALPWLGLPGLPNLPRLLVACPAGFVAGAFLAVGVADLFWFDHDPRAPERRSTATALALEEADG